MRAYGKQGACAVKDDIEALMLREISIVGIGQLPVKKTYSRSLRELGAEAVRTAMHGCRRR